jgi:N-acetylmuramoyl-L-alanine amidase
MRLIITLTVILSFAQIASAGDGAKPEDNLSAHAVYRDADSGRVREIADVWAATSEVLGLYYNSGRGASEVRLTVKGPFRYSKGRLRSPDRLFFDIETARLSDSVRSSATINDRHIKTIRVSQYENGVVRLVLDLQTAADYEVTGAEGRFNVRVFERPDNHEASRPGAPLAPMPVHVPPPKSNFTVVIDAGHGGKDPGAVGRRGGMEKKVALDIARRIQTEFKDNSRIKVKLTRTKDKHVPLSKRTMIANQSDADLFISIHVNGAGNRRLSGIETWFLNATTNKEWQEVADRENAIARLDMDSVTDLDMILNDLSRSFKNSESMNLAHLLQDSIVRNVKEGYGRVHDHGVKWAKFQVLLGARMPAALVEVGFISNVRDEKRLGSPKYRRTIAKAVSAAITEYFGSSKVASLGYESPPVSVAN